MVDSHFAIKRSQTGSDSSFTLNLYGAKKTLVLKGTHVLIDTVRADGKAVKTHPCSPNFANKDNEYGLPQHGPARDSLWTVLAETEDSITISLKIEGGTYPEGLKIMQTARIVNDAFELYTVHTNAGKKPVPVIYGEHFYWDAPLGIENLKINDMEVEQLKDFDTKFTTTGLVIPLDFKNKLEIPGKPAFTIEQENMPVCVAWRGVGDTKYVCVEPVTMNPQLDGEGKPFFGSEKSLIQPGQTKTAFVSIKI